MNRQKMTILPGRKCRHLLFQIQNASIQTENPRKEND